MFMTTGHIEYAYSNRTLMFNFLGEIRAHTCVCFDAFIDYLDALAEAERTGSALPPARVPFVDLKATSQVKGLLIDLNQATYLDSTALGLLAKLGTILFERLGQQAVILSTNTDITTLVKSMGLAKLYVLLCCNTQSACMQSLPEMQPDQQTMLQTVIDAHRSLMSISSNNKSKFSPLVAQLESQVKTTVV